MSALLGGASRVLMAARLAEAPQHIAVQALLVQAVAAQIARTVAARRQATAAQHRASEATEHALRALTSPQRRAPGSRFTRSTTQLIQAARAAVGEHEVDQARSSTPQAGVDPAEQGR